MSNVSGDWGPESRPYPPPPYYPPPPGYQKPPYDVEHGFRWAWASFRGHPWPLIGALLFWFVALVLLYSVPFVLVFALGGSDAVIVTLLVLSMLTLLVAIAAAISAYINGVLKIADGQPVTFATLVRPRRLAAMLGLLLVIALGAMVGFVLFVLPGVVIAFLTIFAPFVLLDRNVSIVEAIKVSAELVKDNIGPILLMWLAGSVIVFVGQLACFVGLFVAIPVATLFHVYTYRYLSDGWLAAPGRVSSGLR
ncbi:hypothetical protein [Micromonospora sp. WMMD736]|uniref:hypothetical protein n=1 Tax=Micromonospora sp. WMMD736 TaxID=3404112 RepID=UPI003B96333F